MRQVSHLVAWATESVAHNLLGRTCRTRGQTARTGMASNARLCCCTAQGLAAEVQHDSGRLQASSSITGRPLRYLSFAKSWWSLERSEEHTSELQSRFGISY